MAINSDIRDQAYQFFVEEAPELLQAIESELLDLHQERSTTRIHTLMRSAHSLKGGAASVGLDEIAALAHRLENIFKALYSDSLELTIKLENQILQAYDCLRLPLLEQITTGSFDAEQSLAIAEPIFTELEAHFGEALLQTQTYIPSSADLGVDMLTSIFEVDVAHGLNSLKAVAANPQAYEVAGELRAQAEVFAGFAELLNLPEFGAIATSVQQALNFHPDRALEITQLAIQDFEACRQAVLIGSSEMKISAALAQLADTSKPLELDTDSIATEQTVIPFSLFELESVFGGAIAPPEADRSLAAPEAIDSSTPASEDSSEIAVEALIEVVPPEIDLLDVEAALEPETDVFDAELEAEVVSELEIDVLDAQTEDAESIEVEWVNFTEEQIDVGSAIELRPSAELYYAPRQSQAKIKAARSSETRTTKPTIRVDSARLEKMNNLVGELSINRNALSLQNDQLQSVVRELLSRFNRFQGMVNHLRDLSDQLLVAQERAEVKLKQKSSIELGTTFDSLEMDNYGALHPQLQDILEDLVQLEETADDIHLFARQSNQILDQQRHQLGQLQNEIIWARMLPLSEILNRFPRILRDLSAAYGKTVQLKIVGAGVLVEKAILEKLHDPLLQLLRNAFDHGIESESIRQNQGKPEAGQIEIHAYHKGNQTIIEIRDDGQGLNPNRIRRRLLQLGWVSPERLAVMPVAELFEYVFAPGFSTVDRVSELSGRGTGLDIVRSQLQAIKGKVAVTSSSEKGTTFTLYLPLTLTITKLIICLHGSIALAIPADCVEEILVPQPEQIQHSGMQRFFTWREQMLPTYRLADLLNYACPTPEIPLGKALVTVPTPQDWSPPLLILRQENQLYALEVDRLVTEQELVIKPFGAAIAPPPYTYGCTILADGSLVPVIDGAALLAFNLQQVKAASGQDRQSPISTTVQTPTILIVDDAATLRRTLALSLERMGYRVLQAQDGREAITQLHKSSAVKLIVCDVEMPNMNGFEFLTYRRQDPTLSQLPVVMLTSRSNEKHRWLAMQLGATAYFSKPYLEQEFLTALKKLL